MLSQNEKWFEVERTDDGKIVDFLNSGIALEPTPEELVRQRYMRILHFEFGYPLEVMRREVSVRSGSKEALDRLGNPIRADIVVYRSKTACATKDQGNVQFVVECKEPSSKEGYNQLVSYIYNTSAEGGIWFNGSGENDEVAYFRRFAKRKPQTVGYNCRNPPSLRGYCRNSLRLDWPRCLHIETV